jgi:hypothetical protein
MVGPSICPHAEDLGLDQPAERPGGGQSDGGPGPDHDQRFPHDEPDHGCAGGAERQPNPDCLTDRVWKVSDIVALLVAKEAPGED